LPEYDNVINIKHLLYHTSGLRDFLWLMVFSGRNYEEDYININDGVKILCSQKSLDFIPGEKDSYSNSGYILLARIIERVSGSTIKEFAEEKIFKPLGMNNTFIFEDRKAVVKNRVVGYNVGREKTSFYLHNFEIADVFTTINDLQKWDNNFYNPTVGGKKFLDLMLTRGVFNNQEVMDYGLGLNHSICNSKLCIGHSGYYLGFVTNFVRFPDHKTSILILCNRDDVDDSSIVKGIADIVLPDEILGLSATSLEDNDISATIELSESELETFCGYYWSEESKLNRKIYQKDGILYYWRCENYESRLVPCGVNEFALTDSTVEIKFIFEFNCNQKTIKFLENGRCVIIFKNFDPVIYSFTDLNKFTGKYYSEELDIIYQLKLESDKLVLCIKDKKISELTVIMQDLFDLIEWGNTTLKFYYDDNNEISGLKLDHDRAKNIKFIKQS